MEKLPQNLNRIINALLENSSITNFNVFSGEKTKLVIYFDDISQEQDTKQFKLKSKKQACRDNQRAANHRISVINNQLKDDANNNFENVSNKGIKQSESESCTLGDKECFRVDIDKSMNSNTQQLSATSLDSVTSDCTQKDTYDINESDLSATAAVFDMLTPPSLPTNCLNEHCHSENVDKDRKNDSPKISPGDKYAKELIKSMISDNFQVDEDDKIITPCGHKISTDLHNLLDGIAEHYASFENT